MSADTETAPTPSTDEASPQRIEVLGDASPEQVAALVDEFAPE